MQLIYNFIDMVQVQEKFFFVWYVFFLLYMLYIFFECLFFKYIVMDFLLIIVKYYVMIEWFDEICGDLVNYLDDNNLWENMFIYYFCDNGWI